MENKERMEEFLQKLLNINPNYDRELITRAYLKAEQIHEGQKRKIR